ncbi:hypothetical protein [Marinicrinis sediminis]|uniref:LytTR family transcriptional regulator n=1 Tax=Marinicrinis sediminis TaxID=1652465 RepID=A0ABW5RFN3_9BACL
MNDKVIPVVKENEKDIHWLKLQDVYFFTIVDNRKLAYYTHEGIFYHIMTFQNLSQLLTPQEGWERLDRAIGAQMKKVTYYDSELGKIFFDAEITKDSIYATVAPAHLKKVKDFLGIEKDISKKT